jgi:hypothetical protein
MKEKEVYVGVQWKTIMGRESLEGDGRMVLKQICSKNEFDCTGADFSPLIGYIVALLSLCVGSCATPFHTSPHVPVLFLKKSTLLSLSHVYQSLPHGLFL